MAVFRVERTGDYTVMSNFHLKDKRLSLKAKGLLSQMLSLPDDWDYTLSGLSYINRESKDAIRSAVNELETAGYIRRRQTTDASGKFAANEYTIFERPIEGEPMLDKPSSENPITVNPSAVNPLPENPTQLNTKKSNTQKQNTHGSNTDSIPFRETAAAIPPERKGRDAMSVTEIENYRELILENIEYDCLKQRYPLYLDDLNEIVELLVETVCAKRKTTRISGADFPHEIVRSRFLKLDSSHIEFVMDCLQKNTTQVRNMKQYLLAVLFNAPIREGMKAAEKRMKELQKLIEYGENYLKYKPVHDELKTLKNGWTNKRDKYEEAHRTELALWNAASRYLHANLPQGVKSLPIAEWKKECAALKAQNTADYTKLKETRAEVAELQNIRKCVEIAQRADQPEQTRAKRQKQER